MGVLFLTSNKGLKKLICICSIMSKFSYPHNSEPYRNIGITIESKSLSLQSNGKLWSLDFDRIKYITLIAGLSGVGVAFLKNLFNIFDRFISEGNFFLVVVSISIKL